VEVIVVERVVEDVVVRVDEDVEVMVVEKVVEDVVV